MSSASALLPSPGVPGRVCSRTPRHPRGNSIYNLPYLIRPFRGGFLKSPAPTQEIKPKERRSQPEQRLVKTLGHLSVGRNIEAVREAYGPGLEWSRFALPSSTARSEAWIEDLKEIAEQPFLCRSNSDSELTFERQRRRRWEILAADDGVLRVVDVDELQRLFSLLTRWRSLAKSRRPQSQDKIRASHGEEETSAEMPTESFNGGNASAQNGGEPMAFGKGNTTHPRTGVNMHLLTPNTTGGLEHKDYSSKKQNDASGSQGSESDNSDSASSCSNSSSSISNNFFGRVWLCLLCREKFALTNPPIPDSAVPRFVKDQIRLGIDTPLVRVDCVRDLQQRHCDGCLVTDFWAHLRPSAIPVWLHNAGNLFTMRRNVFCYEFYCTSERQSFPEPGRDPFNPIWERYRMRLKRLLTIRAKMRNAATRTAVMAQWTGRVPTSMPAPLELRQPGEVQFGHTGRRL